MYSNKACRIILLSCLGFIVSCGSNATSSPVNAIRIKYLDEYVIDNDSIFPDSKIGGLSGIEYHTEKNVFYIVCDDSKNPRFYKTSISIKDDKFNGVSFDKLIKIKDESNQFLSKNIMDLEAIRSFGKKEFIFTSEGSIKNNYNPSIFITDSTGNYEYELKLPSYFLTEKNSRNKPRHNGVFEGLTRDILTEGVWASMELPLESDGNESTFNNKGAPVRITYFDKNNNQADFQFTYQLDKLAKDPKGKFGVNGVTDLLQLNKKQFLIVERGYSAGYGTQGNTVRIYLSEIDKATNTLELETLKNETYKPAVKRLLFDFETVRHQLTDRIVDNIEGITLGPILSNGNQSLILIADNNFNPTSKQINQLILLELSMTP